MTPETVHAFALIGLRALAEYDAAEFKRNTDLSKRSLERRIRALLDRIGDGSDKAELERQFQELAMVEGETESYVASSFMLHQISLACLQRAQVLATGHRAAVMSTFLERAGTESTSPVRESALGHEDYLRLAVMRLLRDLPEYSPLFGYRLGGYEIDCVLQSRRDEAPTVLIEFKMKIKSRAEARKAINEMQRAGGGWGESTLYALLTIDSDPSLLFVSTQGQDEKSNHRAFLLVYDLNRNDFRYQSANGLLVAIEQEPRDSQ